MHVQARFSLHRIDCQDIGNDPSLFPSRDEAKRRLSRWHGRSPFDATSEPWSTGGPIFRNPPIQTGDTTGFLLDIPLQMHPPLGPCSLTMQQCSPCGYATGEFPFNQKEQQLSE